MARHDDDNIGGKEYDPVFWQFDGDKDRAKQLTGLGRKLLGEMKNRMRLGELLWLSNTVKLDDGTVFQMSSNQHGLAPIDKVLVHVPPTAGLADVCLGFIVRGYLGEDATSRVILFRMVTPSGKILGQRYNISGMSIPIGRPTPNVEYDGFNDYGAKYVDHYERHPAFPASDTNPYLEYQTVFTCRQHSTVVNEGHGPVVASWDHDTTLPAMNTGWFYTSEYFYTSGECEPGVTWEEEFIPCEVTFTFTASGDYPSQPVPGPVSTTIPVFAYDGPRENFLGFCAYVYGDPYVDMADYNVYVSKTTAMQSNVLWPVAQEGLNWGYEYEMTNTYVNSDDSYYFEIEDLAGGYYTSGIGPNNIRDPLKRKDNSGVITYSGLKIVDGKFILSNGGRSNAFDQGANGGTKVGHNALVVVPMTGADKRFKYADATIAALLNEDHSVQVVSNVGATAAYGYIKSETGLCLAIGPEGGLSSNVTLENTANLTRTFHDEVTVSSDFFGIPCEVETGVYEVTVEDDYQNDVERKVDILILTAKRGWVKIEKSGFGVENIAPFGRKWTKQINIKVGHFDNISEVVWYKDV